MNLGVGWLALPDCGKPVRSFLPQVSSPPLRRLRGKLGRRAIYFKSTGLGSNHTDLIIYRDCLSCAHWRPPRVAALGRPPPGWQLPQTDLFNGLIHGPCDYRFCCCLHVQSKPTDLEIRTCDNSSISVSARLSSEQSQPLTVENFGC